MVDTKSCCKIVMGRRQYHLQKCKGGPMIVCISTVTTPWTAYFVSNHVAASTTNITEHAVPFCWANFKLPAP